MVIWEDSWCKVGKWNVKSTHTTRIKIRQDQPGLQAGVNVYQGESLAILGYGGCVRVRAGQSVSGELEQLASPKEAHTATYTSMLAVQVGSVYQYIAAVSARTAQTQRCQ